MVCIAQISKIFWPNQNELSRKIVHIGTGPVVPLAWWLAIPYFIVIPAASLISLALLANFRWRFLPVFEAVHRQSFGTIAYGLSITCLCIIFWENSPEAVTAGVLTMSLGDGLAGLIGKNIQSNSWMIWGQKKSFAGTLTMGIVTLGLLTILSILINGHFHPIKIIITTLIVVALEQLSKWGIDNLTVPISVALFWGWLATA